MPANLPPDYYAAERRYREANSAEEKITILREMLAIMPKHKGTEHLQGDLKRKIAKLQSQSKKKTATSRSSGLDHIPSEGAGQAALVGAPNSGKSSIVAGLTNAHTEVADYPFSTFRPVQGMMPYEDIQIQLIDLPPVAVEYSESWLFNIIRLADLVLFVNDLSNEDALNQCDQTLSILEEHHIVLKPEGDRRPQGSIAVKPTLVLGTKADDGDAPRRGERLLNHLRDDFPFVHLSIKHGTKIDELKKMMFEKLRVIRVYTKIPGKKADYEKPYILPAGTTVSDAAKSIHKELADSMTFSRLWGSDAYDGQRVERDHVLQDKDVLEVHTR